MLLCFVGSVSLAFAYPLTYVHIVSSSIMETHMRLLRDHEASQPHTLRTYHILKTNISYVVQDTYASKKHRPQVRPFSFA